MHRFVSVFICMYFMFTLLYAGLDCGEWKRGEKGWVKGET